MKKEKEHKPRYRVREVRYLGGKIDFFPEVFEEETPNQFGVGSFIPEEDRWFGITDPFDNLADAEASLQQWRNVNEVEETVVHNIK